MIDVFFELGEGFVGEWRTKFADSQEAGQLSSVVLTKERRVGRGLREDRAPPEEGASMRFHSRAQADDLGHTWPLGHRDLMIDAPTRLGEQAAERRGIVWRMDDGPSRAGALREDPGDPLGAHSRDDGDPDRAKRGQPVGDDPWDIMTAAPVKGALGRDGASEAGEVPVVCTHVHQGFRRIAGDQGPDRSESRPRPHGESSGTRWASAAAAEEGADGCRSTSGAVEPPGS